MWRFFFPLFISSKGSLVFEYQECALFSLVHVFGTEVICVSFTFANRDPVTMTHTGLLLVGGGLSGGADQEGETMS